jgi:hypothetical protein
MRQTARRVVAPEARQHARNRPTVNNVPLPSLKPASPRVKKASATVGIWIHRQNPVTGKLFMIRAPVEKKSFVFGQTTHLPLFFNKAHFRGICYAAACSFFPSSAFTPQDSFH